LNHRIVNGDLEYLRVLLFQRSCPKCFDWILSRH